jgi:hypothetical protein
MIKNFFAGLIAAVFLAMGTYSVSASVSDFTPIPMTTTQGIGLGFADQAPTTSNDQAPIELAAKCGPWNDWCNWSNCGPWNNWCKNKPKCGPWNNWCKPQKKCGPWNNWCKQQQCGPWNKWCGKGCGPWNNWCNKGNKCGPWNNWCQMPTCGPWNFWCIPLY